ncbi:hypothetical protein SBA2_470042 [Acidobacteriia bacterium SbA2]|nr:hypothetical protein SBA2_470042 [Acidobacteriia bacterium SbA2]
MAAQETFFASQASKSGGINAELNRCSPARVLELGRTTAYDHAKTEGPVLCTALHGVRHVVVRLPATGAAKPAARRYDLARAIQTWGEEGPSDPGAEGSQPGTKPKERPPFLPLA